MVGQDRIINLINNTTITKFPKTSLFIGSNGCGKHTIINLLSDKFNLCVLNITEMLDDLTEYYLKPIPVIYLIDLDKVSRNKQNSLLKFIEEPSEVSFIILISSSFKNVISTIINRCNVIEFDPYKKEDLYTFYDKENKDMIVEIFDTPGQLLNFNEEEFNILYSVSNKIIDNIDKLTYTSILCLTSNFDHDLNLLFKILKYNLISIYKNNKIKKYYLMYNIVVKYCNLLRDNINQKMLFTNFLSELRRYNDFKGIKN